MRIVAYAVVVGGRMNRVERYLSVAQRAARAWRKPWNGETPKVEVVKLVPTQKGKKR